MKTLKIVHNIFTVVALLVAMYIGGGIEATRSDIAWSYIIFFVVVVLLVTDLSMKIRNKIKIACEGQHCLILVFAN